MNKIIRPESEVELLGMKVRQLAVVAADNGRILNQQIKAARTKGDQRVVVELRFDDECGNGHESFSITGSEFVLETKYGQQKWVEGSGGCIHELIAEFFPELEPFIKWNLVSTDGPMHYVANTIYHAGDLDHNGLRKGEVRQIRNGRTGELAWHLVAVKDGEEVELHSLPKYPDSPTQPPCHYTLEYRPWNRIGEGKERNLDAARSSAVWPEATDEDLVSPGLEERLEARLPALMEAFEKDMKLLGFLWPEKRT